MRARPACSSGRCCSIAEGGSETGRPVFAARAAAGPVPIEAGTRVLTVEVNVTYGLR